MKRSFGSLLNSAALLSLTVVLGPLQFSRVSVKGDAADPAPSRAEVDQRTIVLDVHLASRVGESLPAKAALECLRHGSALPYLLGFSLSLSKHQNIAQTNWTLYVSSNNASLVSAL